MPDFNFANHGSITLLRPRNQAARDWIGEFLPDDAMWFGDAVVIEPRYAAPILDGIERDGLSVETR